MSIEELSPNDVELRDLITERLSKLGLINEIKAQLRAGVLLTLSQEKDNRIPIYDQKIKIQDNVKNIEGKLAFSLIKDLLQQLNLKHTLSVFELEAGVEELDLDNRDSIIQNYKNIICDDENSKSPLLYSFLKNVNNKNCDLSDKEIIRGSLSNGTTKNKRILPSVQDKKDKDRFSYKSEDSSDFSETLDIPDLSGKKNIDTISTTTRIPKFISKNQNSSINSEKVFNAYQTQPKLTGKGSLSNDISYEETFSDKSSTPKNIDAKSDDESIKEIDVEEIEERSDSRTEDITIDSERNLSFDYSEVAKKKI